MRLYLKQMNKQMEFRKSEESMTTRETWLLKEMAEQAEGDGVWG